MNHIQQSLLTHFIQDAPIGICIMDPKTFIIEAVNERFIEIAGKPKDSILGKWYWDPFSEVKEFYEAKLTDVARTGISFKIEEVGMVLIRHGQPEQVYVTFTYSPIFDDAKHIDKLVVWVTEHTAKVRVEESNELLNLAVNNADMGVWSVDLSNDKLSLSDRMKQMQGLKADQELTLSESFKLIHEDYRLQVADGIQLAIENREIFHAEYIVQPANGGQIKWLMATASLRYKEFNKPISLVGTAIDITERKLNELRKNDFIGMVSHELKTPITSLSAYLQLLELNFKSEPKTSKIVTSAKRQVKKMLSMVNGFMSVSRMENSRININKTNFNLTKLISEVYDETIAVFPNRNIIISNADQPIEVFADMDRIEQVIGNLVSNALKYSPPESPVEIKCQIIENKARVSISDKGYGIAKEDLTRIFYKYYRVDNQFSNTSGGFGIGLYFCSEIIKLHDGNIWAESTEGSGSTFNFTLPRSN